jgi:hypothetical protein
MAKKYHLAPSDAFNAGRPLTEADLARARLALVARIAGHCKRHGLPVPDGADRAGSMDAAGLLVVIRDFVEREAERTNAVGQARAKAQEAAAAC